MRRLPQDRQPREYLRKIDEHIAGRCGKLFELFFPGARFLASVSALWESLRVASQAMIRAVGCGLKPRHSPELRRIRPS